MRRSQGPGTVVTRDMGDVGLAGGSKTESPHGTLPACSLHSDGKFWRAGLCLSCRLMKEEPWLCCQIEQALAILPSKPPGLAQDSEAAWKMLGAPQGP